MSSVAPTFSVITVTRNLVSEGRSDAIRRAMKSLWAQEFRDVEYVVQDGASRDGTPDLIETLTADAPPGMTVSFQSEPDSGIYEAMNMAVARAKGRYVIFLNSDDELGDRDALAQMAAALAPGKYRFCYGLTERIKGKTGEKIAINRPFLLDVLQRMPFGHNATAFDREMYLDLGGHDVRFRMAADYDFVLRMMMAGHEGCEVPCIVSRFYTGGLTADHVRTIEDYVSIWQKNLGPLTDLARYDQKSREGWYRSGRMPMRVSLDLALAAGTSPIIRQAARRGILRALKHKVLNRKG